jgi:hypothetical protein
MKPLFDYEELDVYRVELAFIAWIADFLGDVVISRPTSEMMIWADCSFIPGILVKSTPAHSVQLSFQILGRVYEFGSRFELGQMLLDTTIAFLNFALVKAIGLERCFQAKEQG